MTTIPVSTVGQVGQERNPDPISRFENECFLIVSGRSAIINSYNIAAAEFDGQLEKLRVLVESELNNGKRDGCGGSSDSGQGSGLVGEMIGPGFARSEVKQQVSSEQAGLRCYDLRGRHLKWQE